MNKPATKNLVSIDLLRFFAAFSVFYYHQHLGSVLAKITHINLFNITDLMGAIYAVPLFFLISGFCIHLSSMKKLDNGASLNLKKYYLSRFWRIYPAYFFALILSIIVNVLINPEPVSLTDFVIHVFILQGFSAQYFNTINLVLWTITIEMAFYLVYPIFYYIRLRWSVDRALCFSAIVSGLSILYFLSQYSEINVVQQFMFTNLWVAWCFGAWLCDKYHADPAFFKSMKWGVTAIGILSVFGLTHIISWNNDVLVKNLINVIAWGPVLIWLIQNEATFITYKKALKIPLALGLASYSLYLLHEPLIGLKNNLIHTWVPVNLQLPCMMLSVFVILLICYLNYILIERPFIAFKKAYKSLT